MFEVEETLDNHKEIAPSHEEIKQQLTEQKVQSCRCSKIFFNHLCIFTDAKHFLQEFQKVLRSKRPMYEATLKSGRKLYDRAQRSHDQQHLENLLAELKDTWDTINGKSMER